MVSRSTNRAIDLDQCFAFAYQARTAGRASTASWTLAVGGGEAGQERQGIEVDGPGPVAEGLTRASRPRRWWAPAWAAACSEKPSSA